MNNKRKLWQIFGPVFCAFVLLGIIFLVPWHFTNNSNSSLFKAAVSRSNNVFKGEKIKQAAFEKEYVPFYGSSELSRMDPMHPSVLAYKYHRDYKPFLLGGPGSQSLTHFMGMQGTSNQLTNKKAVMIISPQWFTKKGQDPAAFSMYTSQLQVVEWILNSKNNETTRYAAKRLLSMPAGTSDETTKSALETLAKGKQISPNLRNILRARHRILENEDDLFSSLNMPNNVPKIQSGAGKLPGTYAYDNLRQIATNQGSEHTSNNRFDIDNVFYKHRLKGKELKKLKGSQKHFDYTKSPEYGDLELVLDQFAQQHTDVLFIIPPVNSKWAKYTGLSESMYQEATNKIIKQLTSQGFTNIANLSKDGNKKYFMEDTIHLGWNGWLTVDQYVQPFMKQQNRPITYNINDYYFSKNWANKTGIKPTKVSASNSK